MFFDSELRGSERISHDSENFGFHCGVMPIIITSMHTFAMHRVKVEQQIFVCENCESVV